ncbi:hypothetical protein [Streptomyces sp. NPDC051997]|uniref:hypothetical protein n=1 Tax=Streptomyces sp. NPDC051997 TaxID=3155611 RepID=UPI0034287BEE
MKDIACAVLHRDEQGNTIPCPGYPPATPEAPVPKPRASVIEIIAKDQQPTEDGAGSIIVPREVRINGIPVFTADGDNRIKVGDIQLGSNMVTVTLTLVARRLVIAADSDLAETP